MQYNFRFSLTEDEYGDYNIYTAWSAPWQKNNRIKFFSRIFLYGGLFMASAFIIMNKIDPPKHENILLMVILGLVFNFLAAIFSYHQVSYKTKNKAIKFVQNEENKSLLGEKEILITNEKLFYNTKSTNSIFVLSSVVRYVNNKTTFYLFITLNSAVIIPKRLFRAQKEVDEFDKFLTERIPLSSILAS
jgi:YcxB-like protein